MLTGSERILGEELPALAKEVARVEAVRKYAGKTLRKTMTLVEVETSKN